MSFDDNCSNISCDSFRNYVGGKSLSTKAWEMNCENFCLRCKRQRNIKHAVMRGQRIFADFSSILLLYEWEIIELF